MRKIRTAVLAGCAALCVAGTAVAASNNSHVMSVTLPDGSVARIEYLGDVAPKVRIEPTVQFVPVRFVNPLDAAPFAGLDQMFANMDRQAAAMLRQAQTLRDAPSNGVAGTDLASLRDAPEGTVSYSFVSVQNGNHRCSRSWRMTAQGAGQQPKLVTASAGDCDRAVTDSAPAKPTTVGSSAKPAAASPAA
jgi:hypothetical protein